ncbi:signal peptidase I [Streptomyces sp. NPDC049597]|uniref:signal peptidase I n=1 Tax=Streptomyces sp. NPDC049597 TaxID=3155276 RepID=UPI003428C6E2
MTGWVLVPLGVALFMGSLLTFRANYAGVTVAGESMSPTYGVGERLFYERVDGSQVRRGDVVLYRMPARYRDLPVIQRVVGVGGDRVVGRVDGGPITVNGKPLPEPYVRDADPVAGMPFEATVPEGRLYMLGDNRGNSRDSRSFDDESGGGSVPFTAVQGRIVDDANVPLALGAAMVLAVVAGLVGAACGLAGWLVGRRRRAAYGPPPVYTP